MPKEVPTVDGQMVDQFTFGGTASKICERKDQKATKAQRGEQARIRSISKNPGLPKRTQHPIYNRQADCVTWQSPHLQQTAILESVSYQLVQVHQALMVSDVMGQNRQHHGMLGKKYFNMLNSIKASCLFHKKQEPVSPPKCHLIKS